MNLFYFEGANLRIKIETSKDLRGTLACLIGGDGDLTDTPKFSGEIIEIIEIMMNDGRMVVLMEKAAL